MPVKLSSREQRILNRFETFYEALYVPPHEVEGEGNSSDAVLIAAALLTIAAEISRAGTT